MDGSVAERAAVAAPRLQPGGRVHVVAPSGPVPMERFDRGLKVLKRRLDADFVLAPNLLDQDGYFAGNDADRLAALHDALGDPDTRVVICARGGYGATRLLGDLDPERLRAHPKILVGFSDITALLCWAYTRANLISVHGPVVTQCARLADEDLERLADVLAGEVPSPLEAEEGTAIVGGSVEGPLVAGNLEMLRSLIGTRYFPDLTGCILAIEEVGERPYRIDRALTQLVQSGSLRGVRGVAVGGLSDCDPSDGMVGPTAHSVVVERLEGLGVPVATGFPFGHGLSRNPPLPFGARVRLDADSSVLEFLEPAAS